MPDLGERGNVIGAQPIMERKAVPPAMTAVAHKILDLLAQGQVAEVTGMATEAAARATGEIASAIRPGLYDSHQIVGSARVKDHYFVNGRLTGAGVEPFTVQFRLGERDGKWIIWEAINLTGRRGV